MSRYQAIIHTPDEDIELDELYDTHEEAEEEANVWLSDYDAGGWDLHMHNPGEYEESDPEEAYYEIVAVDD